MGNKGNSAPITVKEKINPRGQAIDVLDRVNPSFMDDEEYQRLIDAAAQDAKENGLDLLYGLLTAETAQE